MAETLTLLELGWEDVMLPSDLPSAAEVEEEYSSDFLGILAMQEKGSGKYSPAADVLATLGSQPVASVCKRINADCPNPVHCGNHGCMFA